ncbi:sensor histidine kinase [Hymenobacter sp. BT175]|uniref:sensor histidine kinase n=1 Tax=Hymenobacter translucens TaxID=2886507 RepID=UPI001D0DDE50|nr:sensor histidine kinase [Hymenobacter translucens]MCC2548178.1 sensor histidine kinase [Hymenobacter translucens]
MDSWLLPILLTTPLLLLLVVSIIAFVLRYQRRLFVQQQQLRDAHEQAQQQALEAALLAQEDERRRIAADLHDGVGTTLAIVKLHLRTLGPADYTQEAAALLDQAIGEVRRISRNLLPAALQKFGLSFALEALVRTVPEGGPTRVVLAQKGTPRRLHAQHELIIYRVVQELLGNGLRHAQASTITLDVHFEADQLTFRYADDGVGFDPEQYEGLPPVGSRSGLGLTNLRSRVAVLRGVMRHESAPGAGSQVWISFPVPYLQVEIPTPQPVAAL